MRKDADGCGWERLHRHVRIPFAISYFSGTINLKLDVENNRHLGQVSEPHNLAEHRSLGSPRHKWHSCGLWHDAESQWSSSGSLTPLPFVIQIQLESLGQGKFLTKLVASFHLQPSKGGPLLDQDLLQLPSLSYLIVLTSDLYRCRRKGEHQHTPRLEVDHQTAATSTSEELGKG